jgi:hypothetical protein
MWGLSDQAVLGLSLRIDSGRLQELLRELGAMTTVVKVVRAIRDPHELQLWFREPRQAGDFLAGWCAAEHNLHSIEIRALTPLNTM